MTAYEYYREINPPIEKQQVEDFLADYRGTDEEAQDVIKFYKQTKGDVRGLLENIMGSENSDIGRLLTILDEAIAEKEIPEYAKFG